MQQMLEELHELVTPSFRYTLWRWNSTVLMLMLSSRAMALFVAPRARASATRRSCVLSSAIPPPHGW